MIRWIALLTTVGVAAFWGFEIGVFIALHHRLPVGEGEFINWMME